MKTFMHVIRPDIFPAGFWTDGEAALWGMFMEYKVKTLPKSK